ncbi:hypothetical protein [Paracoccus yeei]|uniref:hypothetical protein n=1 Tax=Paracoccus yeei TaxID=147645 RepID=UPI00131444F2|nr:hypothetical protein [Paracoccus yeei]
MRLKRFEVHRASAGATALALPAFQGWAFLDDGIFAAALRAKITLRDLRVS